MPDQSTLTLFIPDLFGFQSTLSKLSKDELSQLPSVKFPVLEKWLSRGSVRKTGEKTGDQDDVIFSELGLSVEKNKDKPFAALSLLAETTLDIEINKESYWLRADPVNLQPDGDTALLSAHEELALTQEEANQLVEKINEHFIDEPWTLFTFAPHRWYLHLEKPAALLTTPVARVLGEDVNKFMPTGNDAKYWWKITNELQMLLHGTSVNFERESRNIVTANSIWLWGGGCLPDNKSNSHYDNILTDNVFFSGLGHHCGFDVLPLNDNFLKNIETGNSFVVLEMLSEYVQRMDLYSFMQELNNIENHFLTGCNKLLLTGKINKIKLISDMGTIVITKKSLRRWWTRVKPFSGFKNA